MNEAGTQRRDVRADLELITEAWNCYGARCETEWLKRRGRRNYRSQFLREGYYEIALPVDVAESLRGFFEPKLKTSFRASDHSEDYYGSRVDYRFVRSLNAENEFFAPPSEEVAARLRDFLELHKLEIEEQLAHCWRVSNVRAWSVKPQANFGGATWHFDGFSRYQRKVMLYLDPPDSALGPVEFASRNGDVRRLQERAPACMLFDAAILVHRGRPAVSRWRPAIEVTLLPSEATNTTLIFAGQNARVPVHCNDQIERLLSARRYRPGQRPLKGGFKRHLKEYLKKTGGLKKKIAKALRGERRDRNLPDLRNLAWRLNIGGGRKFVHRGWLNLEGVATPNNQFPTILGPDTIFPVASGTIGIVYSSHSLEHLDDETVSQMLRETRRAIADNGIFIVKLPDFDAVLKAWQRRDNEMFFVRKWGFPEITPTWPSRGVDDNLDSRAACVFCGFWNKAHGSLFDGRARADAAGAYSGPPVQIARLAPELVKLTSPHEVARRLRQAVVETETDYTFNHQNAWSRDEFGQLLAQAGFIVESTNPDDVARRAADIPGIESDFDISMFFYARPQPARQ
jgi:hypothetical protein